MPHVGFVGLALPLECKLSHLIVLGVTERGTGSAEISARK